MERSTSTAEFSEVAYFQILVVDDDDAVRALLGKHLRQKGYHIQLVSNGRDAVDYVRNEDFHLVLLDLMMPDWDGLKTLTAIRELRRDLPVFLMTAFATVDRAVNAMKQGATEFLLKPLSLDVLAMMVDKIRQNRDMAETIESARNRLESGPNKRAVITRNTKMMEVLSLVAKVASLPSTVLVQGESGSGKELVARAIHDSGIRRDRNFVALNCAVLSAELLASELFGYEKGAFTGASNRRIGFFEAAQGGTIFLDEISEMDVELQAKLLRVIQEKKFQRLGGTREITTDARIIASTNRDLEKEVEQGVFRMDLYYRINVVKIVVPPLRDRPEDIPLLAFYFLTKFSRDFGKTITGMRPKVVDRLLAHWWDGNVRELQNVVEHAVVVAEGSEIELGDLPQSVVDRSARSVRSLRSMSPKPYRRAKRDFEREYLTLLLEIAHGNLAQVARLSEIPRQNLYAKLEKHGINVTDYR